MIQYYTYVLIKDPGFQKFLTSKQLEHFTLNQCFTKPTHSVTCYKFITVSGSLLLEYLVIADNVQSLYVPFACFSTE